MKYRKEIFYSVFCVCVGVGGFRLGRDHAEQKCSADWVKQAFTILQLKTQNNNLESDLRYLKAVEKEPFVPDFCVNGCKWDYGDFREKAAE